MRTILIALLLIGSANVAFSSDFTPVDDVRPMIGTGGHGHTYPGATTPFGLVQLSPDTPQKGWDGCAGYHYSDSKIYGFSHTHLSGTGIGDLGDLLVVPIVGDINWPESIPSLAAENFASEFSHQNETAVPGYYRVFLDRYKILAELTATAHAGMHRYTFPDSGEPHLLLDLVHGINNTVVEGSLKTESNTLIEGYRTTTGWDKKRTIYFALECSQPWSGIEYEMDGKKLTPGQDAGAGKRIRALLNFKNLPGKQILLRVGLSPTSMIEAGKNLRAEIPSWDFDGVCASARKEWNRQLSSIEIESPDPAIRQTFYSALYHSMTAPTLYNNADGSYRGPDGEDHANEGFQYYTTFSLWDTFRAEHPLLTVIRPDHVDDFVQSLLVFYRQAPKKRLPMWSLAGYDTGTMIGYHAVPVIADAMEKGFHGFDTNLAYQASRDAAMGNYNHQDEYRKMGYVPVENGGGTRGAARTLEFAFDDSCIAQMAKSIGKEDDVELFSRRAQNYTNLFDPGTGLFRGKKADGSFREPFDARVVSFDDYDEANAWQYTFFAPQDVPGLIKLYGGNAAFISKLDELFNQDSDVHNYIVDISGLIGQYAHGNEPCHHFPYLYAMAGAQYKTALRVHQIMSMQYDNTPEGICGNDDCGQMSAWYVWSAIGLYPLNPVNGRYVIGSPMVKRAVIRLDPKFYPGGTFTITAHDLSNQNIYVQSATLNGHALNRPWVTHDEIIQGGSLELQMGILPNKNWGAGS